MEGIREQLIKKAYDKSDKTKTIGVFVASVVLAIIVLLLILILIPAGVVIAIIFSGAILYGGYYLTGEFNVEYEYCYSSGELSVDKVINQRRRKPMCSLNLRSAETFYKNPSKLPDDATVFSAVGDSEDTYGILFNDPKYGKSVLLFTPDERMLDAIKPYLPRVI